MEDLSKMRDKGDIAGLCLALISGSENIRRTARELLRTLPDGSILGIKEMVRNSSRVRRDELWDLLYGLIDMDSSSFFDKITPWAKEFHFQEGIDEQGKWVIDFTGVDREGVLTAVEQTVFMGVMDQHAMQWGAREMGGKSKGKKSDAGSFSAPAPSRPLEARENAAIADLEQAIGKKIPLRNVVHPEIFGCVVAGGFVLALNLAKQGLNTLPDSIGDLSRLKYLYLASNNLTTLPASLGNSYSLQRLELQFNKLAALPNSLGRLQSLQTLDLAYNQIPSLPDSIGQLTTLRTLDLRGNPLSSLPGGIIALNALQDLFVGNIPSLPEPLQSWTRAFPKRNQGQQLPPQLTANTTTTVEIGGKNPPKEGNLSNTKPVLDIKVLVQCPICAFEKVIDIPDNVFRQKQVGVITIRINAGKVCDHEFVALLDHDGVAQGYEMVDFTMQPPISKEERAELDSKTPLTRLVEAHAPPIPLGEVIAKLGRNSTTQLMQAFILKYPVYLLMTPADAPTLGDALYTCFNNLLPTKWQVPPSITTVSQRNRKNLKYNPQECLVIESKGVVVNQPWDMQTLFIDQRFLKSIAPQPDEQKEGSIKAKVKGLFDQTAFIVDILKRRAFIPQGDLVASLKKTTNQKINPTDLKNACFLIERRYTEGPDLVKKIRF